MKMKDIKVKRIYPVLIDDNEFLDYLRGPIKMKIPGLLHRQRNDVEYEVLEELYQMWKQSLEDEDSKGIIERETWEGAIMIYAGWSGLELHEYLIERKKESL